jgi:hypothetical protein
MGWRTSGVCWFSADVTGVSDMLKRSIFLGFFTLVIAVAVPTATRAQAVSDEAKAAARELMVVMRAAETFEKLMPTIVEAIRPAIVQGRPEVARDFPQIAKFVVDSFAGRRDVLLEGISLIYARHFTVDELREVTVFMRRPVGQKFIDKTPLISQESMLIGQRLGQEAAVEMREKIIEELRKRGHKI